MTNTSILTLNYTRSLNPKRLTEAREAKGITMAELARILDVSRQAVSAFEKGIKSPSPETLSQICRILGFPERFFVSKEGSPDINGPVHFRSRATATKKDRISGKAKGRWVSLILNECCNYVHLPDVILPNIDIPDFECLQNDDIEDIATQVRRFWNLRDGPITNLTRLLENNGIVIANLVDAEKIDAFSFWYNKRPIIITDKLKSAVRLRFSLAHELGHLILHQTVEDDYLEDKELFEKVENQANYFASCFLLPETTFGNEYYSPNLLALNKLKERWLVSLKCLTIRISELGLISENQKSYIFRQLAPYRRMEPLDDIITREEPQFIHKLICLLDEHSILTKKDLYDVFSIPIKELASITRLSESELLGDSNILPFFPR